MLHEAGSDEGVVVGALDPATRRVLGVCDAVGAFIEYWGFKSIHGRVWTLLALRAEPVAQAEIAHTLGVSRSLVSGAVAELGRLGLVRAVGEHRNAPYEAVMDFWPTIADVLRGREWMLLERARLALEAAIDEVERGGLERERSGEGGERGGAGEGGVRRYDTGRMKVLLGFTELGQVLLRSLMTMRAPRSPDRLGAWIKGAASVVHRIRRAL